ncbi:MAG: hypothetical protein O2958_02410 [Gemmatimonadetes bacterium]|nr:hypothetical protein [Gemmatimonadota bacterium]MDA1102040.1 hypothetical protein [Gemmatimonadota bacterium]
MRTLRALPILILAGLVACADEGPLSGPGTLTATLMSPNGAEGAALVILVGEGIGAVTAVGATEVHTRAGAGSMQIVLINQQGGDLSFQLAVADTTQPPQAIVQEVAGPDDELRSVLTAYVVEFGR